MGESPLLVSYYLCTLADILPSGRKLTKTGRRDLDRVAQQVASRK